MTYHKPFTNPYFYKMIRLKTTITLLLLALVWPTCLVQAQDQTALKYSEELDSLNIKANLTTLAADDFLGRKSSKKGITLAEKYLIGKMTEYKLPKGNDGSYKQSINATHKTRANKYFNLSGYNYESAYRYTNTKTQDSVISADEIIFAGYGIYHSSLNDFANVDVEDKVIMLLEGNGPMSKYGVKLFNTRDVPSKDYLRSQHPKAVLMVRSGFDSFSNYTSEGLSFEETTDSYYPTIRINEMLANKILAPIDKTVKQLEYEYEGSTDNHSATIESKISFNGDASYEPADVNNLVAVIEGSDLKEEYIVLSAHYDHLGSDYSGNIYNGADDNASGVSAVLEIARVLTLAKKAGKGPRRSVVILLTAAEEDGLKGATHYVEDPIFPLEATKACINIDMLGRMGSSVSDSIIEHGYVDIYSGVYKANDSLLACVQRVNEWQPNLKIPTTYGYNYRYSDHYVFHNKGIPALMFTNGEHKDYHKISDDADKIDFKALTDRTKLVFLTVWEFANNPQAFANTIEGQ